MVISLAASPAATTSRAAALSSVPAVQPATPTSRRRRSRAGVIRRAISGGTTTINSGGTLEIGSGYTISGYEVQFRHDVGDCIGWHCQWRDCRQRRHRLIAFPAVPLARTLNMAARLSAARRRPGPPSPAAKFILFRLVKPTRDVVLAGAAPRSFRRAARSVTPLFRAAAIVEVLGGASVKQQQHNQFRRHAGNRLRLTISGFDASAGVTLDVGKWYGHERVHR